MRSSRRDAVAATTVTLLAVAAVVLFASRSDDSLAPVPTPSAARTSAPTSSPALDVIGAVTTRSPTVIRSEPRLEAAEVGRLRSGITLPVTEQREGFLAVLTPCERHGWVASADVDTHPPASGTPRALSEATIVIDPGHGGQLDGAVGPTGLPEQEPNTDIAARLAAKLEDARVFVTHPGDVTAGLGYRAALANALDAHVLVSLHNNADPDGPSGKPGTETYYQYRSPRSKRLAGLLYEELVPTLARYEAAWVADTDAGAKYRLGSRGTDYYALLRGTQVPAVIVEALFVSNASEEALLRRPEVRDAIADAVAVGVTRFFQTDDPGSGFVEPYPREPGPSGKLPPICNDPAP